MDYSNLFGVFYHFCSVFSTRFIRRFGGNLFGVFDLKLTIHRICVLSKALTIILAP